MQDTYEIKQSHGHYEVYINGEFYCSADTATEAAKEVEAIMRGVA